MPIRVTVVVVLCAGFWFAAGCAAVKLPPPPTENIASQRAERHEDTVEEFEARRDEVQIQAALAAWRHGDLHGCESLVLRLLGRNPQHEEGQLLLADVYLQLNKVDAAKRQLLQVIAEHPESAQAHHSLGLLLLAMSQERDALFHLQRATATRTGKRTVRRHVRPCDERAAARAARKGTTRADRPRLASEQGRPSRCDDGSGGGCGTSATRLGLAAGNGDDALRQDCWRLPPNPSEKRFSSARRLYPAGDAGGTGELQHSNLFVALSAAIGTNGPGTPGGRGRAGRLSTIVPRLHRMVGAIHYERGRRFLGAGGFPQCAFFGQHRCAVLLFIGVFARGRRPAGSGPSNSSLKHTAWTRAIRSTVDRLDGSVLAGR